jgi:hypothetical protein
VRRWLAALLALAFASACAEERRLVFVLEGAVDEDSARLEAVVLRPDADTSCSSLLAAAPPLAFPDAVAFADFERDAPPRLSRLPDGRYVVLVRAWSRECRLAQGCQEFEVQNGIDADVRVVLTQFASEEPACPEETQCDDGQCTPCLDCCLDTECNDYAPDTTDACVGGICWADDDLDLDSFPLPYDCDDRHAEAHPGAFRTCGEALDADCDGAVDDIEGCEPAACWLGEVDSITRRPDLAARAVAVSGGLVVAALDDETGGTSLWTGAFDGESLWDLGIVHLVGTEGGERPHGLALVHDVALVLTNDSSVVRVVDVGSPANPTELAPIELPSGADRATMSLTVSPPLLWIARSRGLDVYDVSQIDPLEGWPDLIAEALDPDHAALYQALLVRRGEAYLLAGLTQVLCAPLDSSIAVPEGFETCFDSSSTTYRGAVFSVGQVMAERELFLASANGGVAPNAAMIWRLELGEDGLPSATAPRVAQVPGTPRHLLVSGGTIFRSTEAGLFLHPRADFDRVTEPRWKQVDLDGDPTTEPAVLQSAVLGSSVVIAGEVSGLSLLSLRCVGD